MITVYHFRRPVQPQRPSGHSLLRRSKLRLRRVCRSHI